jgi:hypothetical protein
MRFRHHSARVPSPHLRAGYALQALRPLAGAVIVVVFALYLSLCPTVPPGHTSLALALTFAVYLLARGHTLGEAFLSDRANGRSHRRQVESVHRCASPRG